METKRKCIFILGATRFDAQYESTSFTLAKEFAKTYDVYYVEYPFTWIEKVKGRNSAQLIRRKQLFEKTSDGIITTEIPTLKIVVTPPLRSIHFLPEGKLYRSLLRLNEQTIVKRLTKVIRSNQIEDFIFINSFVFHYPNLADKLHAALRIYHCVDPVITPFDIKHGKVSEKILIKKSDVVVCTSQQLYKEKKLQHPNTYFVPNAADIRHSSLAADPGLQVDESLKDFKKPVIGYFGNIENRIDFDLIRKVAAENPDFTFVFAGPVVKHLVPDFFFKIPNLHFIGRIPFENMPKVLKGFDVAIIPFKKNESSGTVFPLKLFEYLGAGKPVVATDFNLDLKTFTNDLVAYCSDACAFSQALRTAITQNSEDHRVKRMGLAEQHTWEKRVEAFSAIIEEHFNKATATLPS